MTVAQLGTSVHSTGYDARKGWPTYVQFKFAINIPNSASKTEIKAEDCYAVYQGNRQVVVKNGCVVHPIGVMLHPGSERGTEQLTLRIVKKPGTSANLQVRCNFQLCDPSSYDFTCYKRDLCVKLRPRRSPVWTHTATANVQLSKEGRITNFSYT